jgi:basic membrane protein A and related proteins
VLLRALKRILVVFAVLTAACSTGATNDDAAARSRAVGDGPNMRVGLVYDLGGRGDMSFNDLAAAGLDRAKGTLGLETRELTPARGGEDREELLRLLAGEGYGLLVAVGFLFTDAVERVAADFPGTAFVIVDAVVDADNVASLTFADAQGAFLVGGAAALRAEGGGVGFIGGVTTEVIRRFQAGFAAGARHVRPDVPVEAKYISEPPDLSGFRDPARARETARAMFERGARVVFHAAGGSGLGVFEAAREASTPERRVWGIGVDIDQRRVVDEALRPFVLTSMLKQVDVAVFETVRTWAEDRFRSGEMMFDLPSGGVGYAKGHPDLAGLEGRLDELAGQVAAGQVTVPRVP